MGTAGRRAGGGWLTIYISPKGRENLQWWVFSLIRTPFFFFTRGRGGFLHRTQEASPEKRGTTITIYTYFSIKHLDMYSKQW